ncbi:MAG: bifunctional adenosylcobinamide kinase/adenosylcobinamide-phosphate guanylyltransferase [Candidatus Ancaeobacter aquaticus]|nr:bifunctional adenosylcobinamide kinase/adenosylcobinamide-phosphate guanylyltransferase [Candidatus Ancaeobacter aquaticus]
MAKIIFVLGGARSGKSTFALQQAKKHRKVAYIATGVACDAEMRQRIKKHKDERPSSWDTFEEKIDLNSTAIKHLSKYDASIIDCIGGWVSNCMLAPKKSKVYPEKEIKKITKSIKSIKKHTVIIVSNEVGLGLVPPYKMGREFRDILGRVNQILASEAQAVYFMIAGIPQKIK